MSAPVAWAETPSRPFRGANCELCGRFVDKDGISYSHDDYGQVEFDGALCKRCRSTDTGTQEDGQ